MMLPEDAVGGSSDGGDTGGSVAENEGAEALFSIAVDRQGRIVSWPDEARRAFGWTGEQVLGRSLVRLVTGTAGGEEGEPAGGGEDDPAFLLRWLQRGPGTVVARTSEGEMTLDALSTRVRRGDHESWVLFLIPRRGPEDEISFGVLQRARQARLVAREAGRRERFVTATSHALQSHLDLEEKLHAVAESTVQSFADGCLIDLVDADLGWRRAAFAGSDRVPEELTGELRRGECLSPSSLCSEESPLTGEPEGEWLQLSQREELPDALTERGVRFLLSIGIDVDERKAGLLTFLSLDDGDGFGDRDVRLARDLAKRTGVAISQARTLTDAIERVEQEERVLHTISHELRQPVNAILLATNLLHDRVSGDDPAQAAVLEEIELSARRLKRMAEDLLAQGKLASGGLSVTLDRHEPEPMVREAVRFFQPAGEAQSIRVEADLAPRLPTVLADRDRMFQVFSNLISNALDHTPSGGAIRVGARPDGEDVIFFVEDTGRGIAPEHHERIFDSFARVPDAGAGGGGSGGTGLGLSIARGIVEAHGGRIAVESTPGEGSRFMVWIPCARTREDDEEESERESAGQESTHEGGPAEN